MILDNYSPFLKVIYSKLDELGINTSELKIDHIGYQADSASDYDKQIQNIKGIAKQVSESIVGGRRVGVFKLNSSLNYKNQSFEVIEIFEPREGQQVNSAWEHVEFLVSETLEVFMSKYPKLDWDISALNRDEFPMLILKLGDGLRAKFPRLGVLNELERQNS